MKKLIEKIKSLDKGTIFRTLALVFALVNQTVAVLGATPLADELWYQVLSVVLTILTAAIAAWKNNDFTYFAQLTTGLLRALKDGKITKEEAQELLDKAQNKDEDSVVDE